MPIYIIAYETEHETYQSFFRSGSNGMTFLLSLITGNPVKIIVNYIAMNYLISHAAINHAVTRELNTDAYQIASIQFFTFIYVLLCGIVVQIIYLRSFIPSRCHISPRSRYSSKRELHGEHV